MTSPRTLGTSSPRQASTASPLRDRLLSNSPDPVKNQILRDSGLGWSDSPQNSTPTSPLRIAKRDSPLRRLPQIQVARRTSSSFKHVKNNNLVSKSPFKSQIPTPATGGVPALPRPHASPTRRVSGEKRPRPQSIHDQAEAENDRPFSFKRERRQSKTFEGLIQKEPVTKSPFRQLEPGWKGPAQTTPVPPVPQTPSRIPVPASASTTSASPIRSSLVTKRMHGPRSSGNLRREQERRKTVTFNESCDVVEFDPHEDGTPDTTMSSVDQDLDQEDDDTEDFFAPEQEQIPPQHESSYESIDLSDTSLLPETSLPLELDPDTSITGLVDAMFSSNEAAVTSTPPGLGSSFTRTFAYTPDHPTDLDTEDGVPFGRSHHASRTAAFHQEQHNTPHLPPIPQPQLGSRPLPFPEHPTAHTPPRHPRDPLETPPLGRSTHFERRHAVTQEEAKIAQEDDDVAALPGSPSPMKPHQTSVVEIGLTRFSLPSGGGMDESPDPFAMPKLQDEPLPGEDSREISIGRSEVNEILRSASASPMPSPSRSLRPRISREDVQRRLLRARSTSPEIDIEQPVAQMETVEEQDSVQESVEEEEESHRDESQEQADDSFMSAEDEFKEEREAEAEYEAAMSREQEEREGSASTEIGIVGVAEKRLLYDLPSTPTFQVQAPSPPHHSLSPPIESEQELGLNLGLDFGSRFGLGKLGITGLGNGSVNSQDSLQAAERLEPERMAVDMDMRSALDRLMDDVASVGGSSVIEQQEESMRTEDTLPDDSLELPQGHPVARAATDSVLDLRHSGSSASLSSIPPPVPPKDNIRSREALILEKRRELRRLDEDDYEEAPQRLAVGRPSARRSMSTGDVDDITKLRAKELLDLSKEDLLGASIEKALTRPEEPRKPKYHVHEHEEMIYASSSDQERISHLAAAGDINAGKAWKTVRRPSDMNEYSKQIKEYRAMQDPGKACGKVFVKVIGVKGMHLPLPNEPTAVTCTLNNGIHFVTTPETALGRETRIEQEFELIESAKLEFTMSIKVRRDPHIISQFRALQPAPAVIAPVAPARPPPVVQQTSSKSGLRFWASSPKKKDKLIAAAPPPRPMAPVAAAAPARLPENLARYLKPDGTLARAFVAFKDIASRCDTRLFETSFPLIGQRTEVGGKTSTLQVGELVLQILRLPPLPSIPQEQLPQSLDECLRGLRHINWHKVTYFQGTLTQNGGDCSTWRRRQLRVIGSKLVAFNDVTKRATATIDLSKAIAVEDNQTPRGPLSPASGMSRVSQYDEYDGLCGVERSFRLIFPHEQEILFFADSDEDKAKWLEVLRALVGHIPPYPLWGELLWQRQEDLRRRPA